MEPTTKPTLSPYQVAPEGLIVLYGCYTGNCYPIDGVHTGQGEPDTADYLTLTIRPLLMKPAYAFHEASQTARPARARWPRWLLVRLLGVGLLVGLGYWIR